MQQPLERYPLVEARNIYKVFHTGRNKLHALKDISLSIYPGETFGLVGESGSGKSTLARVLLKLHSSTKGEIFFDGNNITNYQDVQMRQHRQKMQIIFQDPYSSLFPHLSVWANITEPIVLHNKHVSRQERMEKAKYLMELVGLNNSMMNAYPHELSGGQQQRVGIARALALNPKFIVCDEPVSALDVSIQAQILKLLQNLQEEFGLTYLFIAHNLAVIESFSTRVGVMYLGKIVETAKTEQLYDEPLHPYTKALLSAVPKVSPERSQDRIILEGEVPSPLNPPTGCPFHTRCAYVIDRCKTEDPQFREVGNDRFVACHLI